MNGASANALEKDCKETPKGVGATDTLKPGPTMCSPFNGWLPKIMEIFLGTGHTGCRSHRYKRLYNCSYILSTHAVKSKALSTPVRLGCTSCQHSYLWWQPDGRMIREHKIATFRGPVIPAVPSFWFGRLSQCSFQYAKQRVFHADSSGDQPLATVFVVKLSDSHPRRQQSQFSRSQVEARNIMVTHCTH